jgi:hypothetical protein
VNKNVKEITIDHTKFKEMKDKMIKVLVNLENIREESKDIHITLEMMINEMTDALKLATGKVHGSNEPEILEIPHLSDKER